MDPAAPDDGRSSPPRGAIKARKTRPAGARCDPEWERHLKEAKQKFIDAERGSDEDAIEAALESCVEVGLFSAAKASEVLKNWKSTRKEKDGSEDRKVRRMREVAAQRQEQEDQEAFQFTISSSKQLQEENLRSAARARAEEEFRHAQEAEIAQRVEGRRETKQVERERQKAERNRKAQAWGSEKEAKNQRKSEMKARLKGLVAVSKEEQATDSPEFSTDEEADRETLDNAREEFSGRRRRVDSGEDSVSSSGEDERIALEEATKRAVQEATRRAVADEENRNQAMAKATVEADRRQAEVRAKSEAEDEQDECETNGQADARATEELAKDAVAALAAQEQVRSKAHEQAEADRRAKLQAERGALAKLQEAQKRAEEEVEMQRKAEEQRAQNKADRLAKQHDAVDARKDAERAAEIARKEAELAQAEDAEAERNAKGDTERKAKEDAEAERKEREDAEVHAKEHAERTAREAAEQLSKEEAERRAVQESIRLAAERRREQEVDEERLRKAEDDARRAQEEADRQLATDRRQAERRIREQAGALGDVIVCDVGSAHAEDGWRIGFSSGSASYQVVVARDGTEEKDAIYVSSHDAVDEAIKEFLLRWCESAAEAYRRHFVLVSVHPQHRVDELLHQRVSSAFLDYPDIDCAGVALVSTTVLTMLGAGKQTGVLCDIGPDGVIITPVLECNVLENAIRSFDCGVERRREWLFSRMEQRKKEYHERIRGLPEGPLKTDGMWKIKMLHGQEYRKLRWKQGVGNLCEVAFHFRQIALQEEEKTFDVNLKGDITGDYSYGDEHLLCAEFFFSPRLREVELYRTDKYKPTQGPNHVASLTEAVLASVMACDQRFRPLLLRNICLSGAVVKGMRDRLSMELAGRLPLIYNFKIKQLAGPARSDDDADEHAEDSASLPLSFRGGQRLASTNDFRNLCSTEAEWDAARDEY